MLGQVVAECADLGGSPEVRIRRIFMSYRAAFFRHPDVARRNAQMARMPFSGQGRAPTATAVSRMMLSGLSDLGLSGRDLMLAYQVA